MANLIKRADGSYSRRGLWDNIRSNKGSGKKPTSEMLKQERKIKAKMIFGGDPDRKALKAKKFVDNWQLQQLNLANIPYVSELSIPEVLKPKEFYKSAKEIGYNDNVMVGGLFSRNNKKVLINNNEITNIEQTTAHELGHNYYQNLSETDNGRKVIDSNNRLINQEVLNINKKGATDYDKDPDEIRQNLMARAYDYNLKPGQKPSFFQKALKSISRGFMPTGYNMALKRTLNSKGIDNLQQKVVVNNTQGNNYAKYGNKKAQDGLGGYNSDLEYQQQYLKSKGLYKGPIDGKTPVLNQLGMGTEKQPLNSPFTDLAQMPDNYMAPVKTEKKGGSGDPMIDAMAGNVSNIIDGIGNTIQGIGNVKQSIANVATKGIDAGLAITGQLQENRLKQEQQKQLMESFIKTNSLQSQTLNNKPIYTKYGTQETEDIEAEGGEVVRMNTGHIAKVQGPRHEQGGVDLSNVHSVLEDTSVKRNSDPLSKLLQVSPMEASSVLGKTVKKSMSHAQVMKEFKPTLANRYKKVVAKAEQQMDNGKLSYLGTQSAAINSLFAKNLPSKDTVFDTLLAHQENIKEQVNSQLGQVYDTEEKAAYGKPPKRKPKLYPMDDTKPIAPYFPVLPETLIPFRNAKNVMPNIVPFANVVDKEIKVKEKPVQRQLTQKELLTLPDSVTKLSNPALFIEDPNKPIVLNSKDFTPIETPYFQDVRNRAQAQYDAMNKSDDIPVTPLDVLAPTLGILGSMTKERELFNPVNINGVKLQGVDSRGQLNANQSDYNAAVSGLQNNSIGQAQASQLFANKLKANNEVIAQTQNQNSQIANQQEMYNSEATTKQSIADAQTRESYYEKILQDKAAQQTARINSVQALTDVYAQNNAFNNNANLIQKLAPYFNKSADYNGKQVEFDVPISSKVIPHPTNSELVLVEQQVRNKQGKIEIVRREIPRDKYEAELKRSTTKKN